MESGDGPAGLCLPMEKLANDVAESSLIGERVAFSVACRSPSSDAKGVGVASKNEA